MSKNNKSRHSAKLNVVRSLPPRSKVYIFHRGDMWYPIELRDDADAVANAKCNPGTTLVTDHQGREVWRQ
jgi:hypothetical protein